MFCRVRPSRPLVVGAAAKTYLQTTGSLLLINQPIKFYFRQKNMNLCRPEFGAVVCWRRPAVRCCFSAISSVAGVFWSSSRLPHWWAECWSAHSGQERVQTGAFPPARVHQLVSTCWDATVIMRPADVRATNGSRTTVALSQSRCSCNRFITVLLPIVTVYSEGHNGVPSARHSVRLVVTFGTITQKKIEDPFVAYKFGISTTTPVWLLFWIQKVKELPQWYLL